VLTQVRVAKLPDSPLKSRATRTVQIAGATFQRISEMVQAAQRMSDFMSRTFNVKVTDLFNMVARPGVVNAAEGVGFELVITKVNGVINELARLNRAIDEEAKNGTDKKE